MIYFADMCNNIKAIFTVITIILFVTFIIIGVSILESDMPQDYLFKSKEILEQERKQYEKNMQMAIKSIKLISIIGICSLVVSLVTPSTETVYKMIIAENVTYNNLEKGKGDIKQIIDYTVEKINEINNNEGDN